jgi:hypothetical protein
MIDGTLLSASEWSGRAPRHNCGWRGKKYAKSKGPPELVLGGGCASSSVCPKHNTDEEC